MNTGSYGKFLNKRQTELRRVLTRMDKHEEAIQLFLSQHAMLHPAKMAQTESRSFADEILNDMTEEQIRRIPRNCEHSVAWCVWHIARIEDVAMNLLVSGSPQVLNQNNWPARLKITFCHTGNAMEEKSVAELSEMIDLETLWEYRIAVGRRTRQIVQQIEPAILKQKVDPSRLQQVWDEGAMLEAASGIVDYWGKRDIAGLLLMPATRHNLVHLNEALKLKRRRQ